MQIFTLIASTHLSIKQLMSYPDVPLKHHSCMVNRDGDKRKIQLERLQGVCRIFSQSKKHCHKLKGISYLSLF